MILKVMLIFLIQKIINTFYFLPIKCFLVFFSGLNKIIKHFGKNIQKINPKLEANIAKTSTATVNLPGELI